LFNSYHHINSYKEKMMLSEVNVRAADVPSARAAKEPDFPTETRAHVELAVRDLDQSLLFYRALFNRPPVEIRQGHARFNPYNPAVDFILREDADAMTRDGHFGIQLKYTKEIERFKDRLENKGFKIALEEAETACCFSVANKAWINDPDDNQWELWVVTGENTSEVRCGPSCACESGGCS
jgi:catechol 2,3-dioxygenase-like lactoylglutathione lyase family enzyme